MNHEQSLSVPILGRSDVVIPSRHEKKLDRAIKASLIAFLIAVALVSFVSNKFGEYEKKLSAASASCQANTQQAAKRGKE